jgi:hypothetical protein
MGLDDGAQLSCRQIRKDGEDVPHGRNHALDTSEQHHRSQVDHLVRLRGVAFGRLARTQHGQERVGQVELHELRRWEELVLEDEATLECALEVLGAVACDVQDRGQSDVLEYTFGLGDLHDLGELRHTAAYCTCLQSQRKCYAFEGIFQGHEQGICVDAPHRLEGVLSM